ncbi:MAG: carotenoid oxygenase family protein [Zetaproteobacteria bacterium]|nr:carotenoid oxygenase family protein [Zetaproteobacteria bacterium]
MSVANYNLKYPHAMKPLRVEGTIPSQLRGTLYRAGPGLIERFGKSVHPFLADGAITSVEISSQAKGACRMVETDKYLQEEACGRTLYDTNAPLLNRVKNALVRNIKSTGNTHILSWQNRFFALMEAGKPVEFDPQTLETIGTTDLDMIQGAFSAHPHRVERLKTTFNFGIRGQYIDLFSLPDIGHAKRITTFKAPWASLIHDFMMTDKHAIFFISPSKLVVWRAVLGLKDFSKYFSWDAQESTFIIVVPLNSLDKLCQFEVDAFHVWHFANAYEDGEDIIVDACRHDDIGTLGNPIETTANDTEPAFWRFRINPKNKQLLGEEVWSVPCEFPMVNLQLLGSKHRYAWVQTYKDKTGNGGFARIDTETQKIQRWYAPDHHQISEPLFVSKGQKEEEGWVLQLTQDLTHEKSYLAIIDSQKMDELPVAKLWFDQAIPMTFHGAFIKDSSA